jgi:hypothetical protein
MGTDLLNATKKELMNECAEYGYPKGSPNTNR